MRSYRPSAPFSVPMILLVPTETKVKGIVQKTFPDPTKESLLDYVFYGSFRTFGGSETMENDLYAVVDTARIDTWFRPDIKSNCRIYLPATGDTYQIIGSPENIDMRNQYLQIRVEKLGGGA